MEEVEGIINASSTLTPIHTTTTKKEDPDVTITRISKGKSCGRGQQGRSYQKGFMNEKKPNANNYSNNYQQQQNGQRQTHDTERMTSNLSRLLTLFGAPTMAFRTPCSLSARFYITFTNKYLLVYTCLSFK